MATRDAETIRAEAALRRAMSGELNRSKAYSVQKQKNKRQYRIGLPPMFVDNSPVGKHSELQSFIDLENGALVYVFDTDEIDSEPAAD